MAPTLTLEPVRDLIEKRRKENMESHPFISWLKCSQAGQSPRDKILKWLPSLSSFAMGYKDHNNLFLKYPVEEAMDDPLKALINRDTEDDGRHYWALLMKDIKIVGANTSMDLISFLTYYWSEGLEIQRKGMYDLMILANSAQDPVLRYCLVAAFEMCGLVVIKAAVDLGEKFEKENGQTLHFFGRKQLEGKGGPSKMQDDAFWNREVDKEILAKCLKISSEVFEINLRRWDGFFESVNDN